MEILVSVVIAVRNGETYIGEAIQSVLNQTYSNTEIIVVDDASQDNSRDVVRGIKDPRIRLIALDEHLGIPDALNKGLEMCQGMYIARLDADDIATPNRIADQFDFLQSHPEVVVTGGCLIELGGSHSGQVMHVPIGTDLGHLLLRGNILKSSSVMVRRSSLAENKIGYRSEFPNAQDYALWIDLARVGKIANQPIVFGWYRRHLGQQTSSHNLRQRKLGLKAQAMMLSDSGVITRYGFLPYIVGICCLGKNSLGFLRAAIRRRLGNA